MSNKSTTIVIALVSLGVGIFLGTKLPKNTAPSTGQADTYQAGWDAAKARLAESPVGIPIPMGLEFKTVNGVIQKIDGNKLTVKINPLEPLADPSLDTRIITADSNTKITLSTQKDGAVFQKEMQDFQLQVKQPQKQTQVPTPMMPPPSPFSQKDIKLSDLKINQQISATAGTDIKNTKEFIATRINAQAVITAAPAPIPQ